MTSVRRPAASASNMDNTGRMARDEGRVVPAASPAATSAMSTGNWAASLVGEWEGAAMSGQTCQGRQRDAQAGRVDATAACSPNPANSNALALHAAKATHLATVRRSSSATWPSGSAGASSGGVYALVARLPYSQRGVVPSGWHAPTAAAGRRRRMSRPWHGRQQMGRGSGSSPKTRGRPKAARAPGSVLATTASHSMGISPGGHGTHPPG